MDIIYALVLESVRTKEGWTPFILQGAFALLNCLLLFLSLSSCFKLFFADLFKPFWAFSHYFMLF